MCEVSAWQHGARMTGAEETENRYDELKHWGVSMSMGKAFVVLMASAVLLGCGSSEPTADQASESAQHPVPQATADQAMTPRRMQMWADSCALCHVDGNAFATRVGNAEEWLPRLAKGHDALLQNTINGLNAMPPLGYCMACEADDFSAMISFMTTDIAAGDVQ